MLHGDVDGDVDVLSVDSYAAYDTLFMRAIQLVPFFSSDMISKLNDLFIRTESCLLGWVACKLRLSI